MNGSTEPTRHVNPLQRILRELVVDPYLMFQAMGDRYRLQKKHQIAADAFRAGLALGREIERRESRGKCTCGVLPQMPGKEQSEGPLRAGGPEAERMPLEEVRVRLDLRPEKP